MAIQVGCGSWTDPEYVGILYPSDLPATQRLGYYARWFDHVEVNSSFYAIPDRKTVAKWAQQTPTKFFFDLKLHKALSRHHATMANLPRALRPAAAAASQSVRLSPTLEKEMAAYTLAQAEPLIKAGKLGAFLLLLTPQFTPEKHRLEELDTLVEALKGHALAVELRNRHWVEGKNLVNTLAYFRERGITWVAVDMPHSEQANVMPAIDEVTQPKLGYLRLHGRNEQGYLHGKSAEERFHYDYNEAELQEIVARIRHLAAQAENLRVVASNHAENFAPKAALQIKRMLGQKVPVLETTPELKLF